MFVVYDVIENWQDSPWRFETREEVELFFSSIHKKYFTNYRIVKTVNGIVVLEFEHEHFSKSKVR